MMKYIAKRLPDGFIYAFTKKETIEINRDLDNCIAVITEDGTSYCETKMTLRWMKSITAAVLKTETVDSNLIFNLKLEGFRKSNFKDNEKFLEFKSKIKEELINRVNDKKTEFKESVIKHESIFLTFSREEEP